MPRYQDSVIDKSDYRSAIDQFTPYIRIIRLDTRAILYINFIDKKHW